MADKVLFPRVWEKLCQALTHREILMAGMASRLKALEECDEVAELQRIDQRLDKLHHVELSYAEPRAEGILAKNVHQELIMRVIEERRELLLVRARLADKLKNVEEARKQSDFSPLSFV